MPPIFEKKVLPSPLPEHVRAPPSTPASDVASFPETSDDTQEKPPFIPTAGGPQEAHQDGPSSLIRRSHEKPIPPFLGKFRPSLVLENSGSVARDHLASERTFLAYVRTSLLLATTGVALVQLFSVASANPAATFTLEEVRRFARPLGGTLIIFGLFVLAVGVRRYFLIQTLLVKGYFPITRFAITGITIVVATIITIVFGILVSARS